MHDGLLIVMVMSLIALGCDKQLLADAVPPARPDASLTSNTNTDTFAIDSIELGDDKDGTRTATAWQFIGYDLDGLTTTRISTDGCRLEEEAPKTNQVDGARGIDNGFGACVVPLVDMLGQGGLCIFACGAGGNSSADETAFIQSGLLTTQLSVRGLSSDPTQTAVSLEVQARASDAFDDAGTPPAFDTTTKWPVLDGLDVKFNDTYVVGGTVVSGASGGTTLPLRLMISNVPLTLFIHDAIVTFDHVDEDDAAHGVIAGVLDTSEFLAMVASIAARVSTSFCGSAVEGLLEQLAQCQDIVLGGANVATAQCNAISLGIGFHARRVSNPTMSVPIAPAPPDPCHVDAGTD